MKKHSLSLLCSLVSSTLLFSSSASAQVADAPDATVAQIPVNYTEAKVGNFPLPDPFTLLNGQPVKDAATWFGQRRPEIVKFFESQVYGRIPATAPKVTWEVASVDRAAMGGTAVVKTLLGHMGSPTGPAINVMLYTPAKAVGPVPVLIGINFGNTTPVNAKETDTINKAFRSLLSKQDTQAADILQKYPDLGVAPTPPPATTPIGGASPAQIAVLLSHGIGYASLPKGDVETDTDGGININIVRKMALTPGQTKPAADEWGAIAAWAWSMSRLEDYFETDKDVDAKRVAITGGSRLGKTVLWAGVNDQRFAAVLACSGGEGGAALARRNYGETIAHLVAPSRYPYQFAANYAKYAAHPEESPMDTNLLVAAMAPRPLLLHTANQDGWSDPKGEYLAAVNATKVYELVGKKGLDRTPDSTPVTSEFVGNDLAFYLNNGGHASINWDIYLKFLDANLHPTPPPAN